MKATERRYETCCRSPALQVVGKMKSALEGRAVGILIAGGSDGAAIQSVARAATVAGASVTIVATALGPTRLANGSTCNANGQLAGTSSVAFDAVAVILSSAGVKSLAADASALDFVRDAFGHLKSIGVDAGGRALLKIACVAVDAGVTDVKDTKGFIAAAKTRQWARESSIRTLA